MAAALGFRMLCLTNGCGCRRFQEIFGREASAGGECVICLEGALDVVLLPCRHQCVCRVCLKEIDRCPICRAKFSTYVCLAAGEPHPSDAHVEVKVDPL